jgi:hypothetical protein
MAKHSPNPSLHSSFLSSDNDDDVEVFCKLEEALQSDSDDDEAATPDNLRAHLQGKFPALFGVKEQPITKPPQKSQRKSADDDQMQQILLLAKQLQESYDAVKAKKLELDRDRARLQKERKAFAREKATFESDQIFAESRGTDSALKTKYQRLKDKFDLKEKEWGAEKLMLLGQIEDLRRSRRARSDIPELPPVVMASRPADPDSDEELNDDLINVSPIADRSRTRSLQKSEVSHHDSSPSHSVKFDVPPPVETSAVEISVADSRTASVRDVSVTSDSIAQSVREPLTATESVLEDDIPRRAPNVKKSPPVALNLPRTVGVPAQQQQPVTVIRAMIPKESPEKGKPGSPQLPSSPPRAQVKPTKTRSPVAKSKKRSSGIPERTSRQVESKGQIVDPAPQLIEPATQQPDYPETAIPDKYHFDFDFNPGEIVREVKGAGGRKTIKYQDGSSATVFANGTRKVIRNGSSFVFYQNGDISQGFPDEAVAYRYAQTGAIELTLPDQTVYCLFVNGQTEKHLPTGEKIIRYPNGTIKVT